jgi:hypothetical protein
MRRLTLLALFALISVVLAPTRADAQASITGVVRDTSGAVLPGVTVEASSPALIERVRSVVTSDGGQYRILDLRPGTYVVSFTLPGFSTVRREGVELTGSFIATINADLGIGGVEETLTVTGESPIVDVQNVSQQRVMGKEVLDAIPSGRSQFNAAVLIPGVSTSQADVGGTNTLQITTMTIHGGRGGDFRLSVDGVSVGNVSGTGAFTDFVVDTGSAREVVADYGSGSAEMETGGIRLNVVPREGGNAFTGSLFLTGANHSFQGDNYTQELQDLGLGQPNSLKLVYDLNGSGGGRILRDKLWFYSSARGQTNQNYVAGIYENLNAGDPAKWTYEPDMSRQGVFFITHKSVNTRLTWQASPRNKISIYGDNQWRTWHHVQPTHSPEAASRYEFPKQRLMTVGWTSPLNDRMIVNATFGHFAESFLDPLPPVDSPLRKMIAVEEQGGLIPGLRYRGRAIRSGPNVNYDVTDMPNVLNSAASFTYVTGAHAFKTGFTNRSGLRTQQQNDNDYGLVFRFNNGVPNQIWQRATPFEQAEELNAKLAVYVQDTWTVKRLTLNGGLRFDYFNFGFPEQHLGPGPLVPTRNLTFERIPSWVSFKDISPRLGAVYDLFGNGKTAVKVSANRYVESVGTSLSSYSTFGNPVGRLSTQISRSWNDSFFPVGDPRRQNFWPDCDLLSPVSNGECGAMSDQNFGLAIPTTSVDPAVLKGWGVSPYNWEFSTSVQHELVSRVGIDVGYFRRIYGNFTVTDNLATAPGDFDPFSITAPLDARLPGGGGYLIDDLYNLNPTKVGQVDNLFTFSSNYGKRVEHWNGVDANVSARLRGGLLVQGGMSTGRTTTDNCDVVTKLDNPSRVDCRVVTSFLTQYKALGTYTVPKIDLRVAATFQSVPGAQILATFNASNAQVQPSLGRPLSGGAANTPVSLVSPGTMYNERANQVDLRFSKLLRFGRTRAAVNLDLYNALNAAPVLAQNNTYTAAAWLRPQRIMDARLFKISAQLDF